MAFFKNSAEPPGFEASATLPRLSVLLLLVSLVPLTIVLPMAPTKAGIAVVTSWIALIWIAISFVRGQFHRVAPIWVAVYPYCYYFLSYPTERSIFTADRAFIVLLGMEMLINWRSPRGEPLTRDLRISTYMWTIYLLVSFLPLTHHDPSEVLPSYRLLVDGMLMPAVLGLYAIRYSPVLEDVRMLHAGTCVLGLGLFITGLIELTTGIDLLPWNGSQPMFTDTHVRRADGPFEQQIVLSVVAILVFFFIIYLRRIMPHRIAPWRALLHKSGSIAAFGAALLPLNRGLVLVLVPIALIDSFSKYRLISRRAWALFFGLILLAAGTAKMFDPRLYDDRISNPDNAYQRVAQHLETLRVVREYPFFGVGFGLYYNVVSRDPRYMARWKGIESMVVPHNVLMTVLSEEGIVGLFFYVAAQLFFFRAMWRIRRAYPPGWLVFLYCILVYLLIGLDFATVYFSDINLLYMFFLGLLFQIQTKMAREQGLYNGRSLQKTYGHIQKS